MIDCLTRRWSRRVSAVVICTVSLTAVPRVASGQSADNILLVINERSPASVQIGEYYARRRGVGTEHIVRLSAASTEAIDRQEYETTIEEPIGAWLEKQHLQDRVLYLVLTKGVPLRINGTVGLSGTVASVDSELTLLYRKLVGLQPVVLGQVANPYFLDRLDVSRAKPFTRAAYDIYLVTRLDGYTTEDVIGLIDRGSTPTTEGSVVLDQRATLADPAGDQWLDEAASRLRERSLGSRVNLESTPALASSATPALGYYSWGSNDGANRLRRFGITFAPGAIAGMYVSTDARTLTEPPADWTPGSAQPSRYGTQSLVGDLIRDGVTGVAGHVAEPFLNATVRPQILFPAYFSGFNLAESFYMGMPYLSWQTIVIGDPLCAPFARPPVSSSELASEIDAATTLPARFAERRLIVLARTGLNRTALQAFLRGEVEIRDGQTKEGEGSLARAAELEPRFDAANLQLAAIYRDRNEPDNAIERYRRVIANNSTNVIALNNLAFALAVDKQLPKDALPFAERAYQLSPQPLVLDTLAWIHYLLGDAKSARPLIERGLAAAPESVDLLLHAAFIFEAVADPVRAIKTLDAAEKIDAQVTERHDVRALRDRLRPR